MKLIDFSVSPWITIYLTPYYSGIINHIFTFIFRSSINCTSTFCLLFLSNWTSMRSEGAKINKNNNIVNTHAKIARNGITSQLNKCTEKREEKDVYDKWAIRHNGYRWQQALVMNLWINPTWHKPTKVNENYWKHFTVIYKLLFADWNKCGKRLPHRNLLYWIFS